MEKAEHQLHLALLGKPDVLPPEVETRTTQAVAALLLQILRAEREGAHGAKESKEGETDDSRE